MGWQNSRWCLAGGAARCFGGDAGSGEAAHDRGMLETRRAGGGGGGRGGSRARVCVKRQSREPAGLGSGGAGERSY